MAEQTDPRLDALERIDVYAANDSLDATCGCGAELHGAKYGINGDSTYNATLLLLVERAMEHRHVCPRA